MFLSYGSLLLLWPISFPGFQTQTTGVRDTLSWGVAGCHHKTMEIKGSCYPSRNYSLGLCTFLSVDYSSCLTYDQARVINECFYRWNYIVLKSKGFEVGHLWIHILSLFASCVTRGALLNWASLLSFVRCWKLPLLYGVSVNIQRDNVGKMTAMVLCIILSIQSIRCFYY